VSYKNKGDQRQHDLKRAANRTEEEKAQWLAGIRRWQLLNRAPLNAQCAAYYERNKDAIKAKRAIQRKMTASENAEKTAKWREENPEKVLAWRNSPSGKLSQKKSMAKEQAQRRGHGKLDMKGFVAKCVELQWVCQICGKILSPETVTIDHIVALSRGGTNELKNLQPLCRMCNCKKQARPMKVMIGSQFLFD
jgi:chromatin remodeling complex protein RSC6